jgi:hypothetical protein
MISSASVFEQPSRRARPNGVMPYTIPKLTIFAPLRCSRVTSSSGTPWICAATAVWMSSPFTNASISVRVLRQVRQQAQLDLRVVRADQHAPLGRDERPADLPPDLGADRDVLQVRIDDDSRPVAATVWLKLAWMRPVLGLMSSLSATRYVFTSFVSWRYSRISAGSASDHPGRHRASAAPRVGGGPVLSS